MEWRTTRRKQRDDYRRRQPLLPPPTAINRQYFTENNTHTVCHWKGVASYYDLVVDGKVNSSAAWYYPEPKAAAGQIKDYVAFWRGVQVMA